MINSIEKNTYEKHSRETQVLRVVEIRVPTPRENETKYIKHEAKYVYTFTFPVNQVNIDSVLDIALELGSRTQVRAAHIIIYY